MSLKYLVEDTDRHGNVRVYFRRGKTKIRLRAEPGTDAFRDEYKKALNGNIAPTLLPEAKRRPAIRGSLRWLIEEYFQAAAFRRLKKQGVRRRILDQICEERFKENGDTPKHGDKPFKMMQPRHVRKIRDARSDAPEAANARIKALRQVFKQAIDDELTDTNPANEVDYIRTGSDGFHTWTVDEVRRYQDRHSVGTKARLALDLMALTGVRRSDAVRLGPQMARGGFLHFTETKGQSKLVKVREIQILPALQASIDATPSGHLAYLVTTFGKPFTSNGFGNWFKKRCREADLPHCSAHGLRKAGATIAADNGATEHQLMAVFGWESTKQASVYTRKANRKKLAADAMHLLEPEQRSDETVPPSGVTAKGGTTVAKRSGKIKA